MNIKKQIILDCDPGQDDAVALALAMAAKDEIDLFFKDKSGILLPLPTGQAIYLKI